MTYTFENRTEFFHCDNHENAAIYNALCNTLKQAQATFDLSMLNLAKVHAFMRFRDQMLLDFMELWREEDYAVILYAESVVDENGNTAFIIAFSGKGFIGEEITIYEF